MNPTHFSIAARVAKPLITASSVLLGRAALCARGRRPARSPSAPRASLGASSRSPARPRHRPRAPQPGPLESQPSHTPTPQASHPTLPALIAESTPNFACNSPETTSNLEFRSLELQRFQTLLKLLPIELHASFLVTSPAPPPTGTSVRPTTPQPGHSSGKKFSQHAQKTPKSALFHQQGEFCHGPTYGSPRRTLRPQPKPRVACAHATTPVAHWPHG